MLKIGARAHDYGKQPPKELFTDIKKAGFSAVMLAYQKAILGVESYYDVTDKIIEDTKNALLYSNLELDTLGVYMELGMTEEAVRQKAVDQFVVGLEVAEKMGIKKVATETTSLLNQPVPDQKQAYMALTKSMETLLRKAEETGRWICLEPVYSHTLSSSKLAKKLIDDMQSKNLKITFDAANLLSKEWVDNQYYLWDESFDLLGEYMECIHMKGVAPVNGNMQETTLENSIIDYPYVMDKIKALDKPLHIIRENINPLNSQQEITFLESLCK